MTLGVLAHEFGHDIGLPDLYDTNGSTQGYSYGVGDWCLMGSGSWNAKNGELDGESPSNISAWGRLFLGWSDVTNIVASGPGTINNTSYPGDMYRIWAKGDENTDEYYLVELREIRNDQLFDEAIPGEGVLIWHVDEGKVDSTIDINSVNDDSSRLGVELEQADGLYEIKKANSGGDHGDVYDVFFGTVGSHNHFTAVPHKLNYSNLNDANYNYVDVLNIDITGSTATFDIYADYDYPKKRRQLYLVRVMQMM